jgi:internalin A
MAEKTPEEIAIERIDEAITIGSNHLDLANLKLTSLPEYIKQLNNVVSLDLSNNLISDFPIAISKLPNLSRLNLYNNRLAKLPINFFELINLAYLNISFNEITVIPKEIGKLGNLKEFYYSFNLPTIFPAEIWQLTNLLILSISSNELSAIPPQIGQLTNLRRLNVSGNKFKNIPDEFWNLTKITSLTLYFNQIKTLSAKIQNFSNLVSLDLDENQLTNLPPEVGQLKNLEVLNISNNQISQLPSEIGQLTCLKSLKISKNHLSILPSEIGHLSDLEEIILSNRDDTGNVLKGDLRNKIETIPVEIKSLKFLKKLDLRDNSLEIPPEILEKTEEPQVILNYYFTHLKNPLNECKILVIGQGSVGKTSLTKQLIYRNFNSAENKTEGIVITHWKIENDQKTNANQQINLNIWDFGGQEIMHSTHQFFLTKRSLYLLVLDSRLTQEENRAEYWLKIIQSFGGESPVLIVGNKIDQHPLDIDRTGLQKKYPNIVGVLETSAATGAGIEELKAVITEQVNNLPHVRDLLPETWFTVKTKLEELGKQSNFITHDKYLDLCAENEVSDETSQRTLIGFLHDLGVVLHFQDDPRLEALGILNPQWVTNGVYKILNSHTLFQNKGVLTVSMLDEILNLPEYPRGKRLFIVDMMKKFELCYDIEPDKTFLVPDLLPKDEPAELKFNGVPAFEYAYPVLPSSVITRFIVRMNQKIENHFVWRTGVVLKIGENLALVKADIEDRKITIAIDGVEHTRRDALSAIRYQLDEIHASIKGLDAQKRVPIPNAPNAEPLEYDYLLMLEREGDETCRVKDGSRLVTVNVRQVLSAIETEKQRKKVVSRVINIYGDVKDSNILTGDENEVNK